MNLKLTEKRNEAKETKSFFFEVDEDVKWLPGQYVYITLPKLNYPDEKGNVRDFTICSSPTEGKLIRIATRIRESSGFKKTLDELAIGDTVTGKGPYGSFIFNPSIDNTNNIFLAGGIGIAPFRSFIKFNTDNNLNIPMHLIYSNTNEDEIAFKDELIELGQKNNFLKTDFIITSKEGHLDEVKIKNLTSKENIMISTFWIVGPPGFVTAMELVLEKLGVASDKIRIEKFTGY